MSDLEPESQNAARARRSRAVQRSLSELALATAFISSLFGARYFSAGTVAFAFMAVGALALWFAAHVMWHRRLDEFERDIELRALALAGGVVVLFAATWGIFETLLSAPDFPIALLAPLFAGIFAIGRFFLLSDYR